ncbi:MAG: hypothetical protein AAF770_02805 [Bacteroidota bacterium]
MKLTLHIRSLQEGLFSGEIDRVRLPGAKGKFEVRWNHSPLITILNPGEIIYYQDQEEYCIQVGGGIAQVENNTIYVWL